MMTSAVFYRWRRGVWPLLLAAALGGQGVLAHAAQRASHAQAASAAKVAKASPKRQAIPPQISAKPKRQLRQRKVPNLSRLPRPSAAQRMAVARVPSAVAQRVRPGVKKRARPVRPSTYRVQRRIALKRQDFQCLARNIYHESRGEPRVGKLAVAQITLNRVQAGTWGKSVCQVVYAPAQFSWTGQPSKRRAKPEGPDWDESVRVAQAFLGGERVRRLEASTHFHSQSIRPPGWTRQMRLAQQVGQHIFFYDRTPEAS